MTATFPADRQDFGTPDVHDFALYTGDATDVISGMPPSSVDCIVTSPPYWRLRDYSADQESGTGGTAACRHQAEAPALPPRRGRAGCVRCRAERTAAQIGMETTPTAYVANLRRVFTAALRVLTPRATVWLNLGDSYSTNSDGYRASRPGRPGQPCYRPPADVPHKNLVGMPWRVALALQADGWILRSAVVWHKPRTTPMPVRDRLTCRYEMLFLFARQPDHHVDLDAIREPNTGDVWTINPVRGHGGHPAAFPVELATRCVAAGSPPGGHVLDPFSGSATTGIAALTLGRRFTGIDLEPGYQAQARERLNEHRAPAAAGGVR